MIKRIIIITFFISLLFVTVSYAGMSYPYGTPYQFPRQYAIMPNPMAAVWIANYDRFEDIPGNLWPTILAAYGQSFNSASSAWNTAQNACNGGMYCTPMIQLDWYIHYSNGVYWGYWNPRFLGQ